MRVKHGWQASARPVHRVNREPWESFKQGIARPDLCFRKMTPWKMHRSGEQECRQGHRLEGLRGSGRRRQRVVAAVGMEALRLEGSQEGNSTEPGDRSA